MAPPNISKKSPINNNQYYDGRWLRWISGTSMKQRLVGGFCLLVFFTLTQQNRGGGKEGASSSHYHYKKQYATIKSKSQTGEKELPPWSPGTLDIHHLQVGSSVSTFVIMPDGTTMLIDAGDVNVPYMLKEWSQLGPPFDQLDLKRPYPNDSKTPVEWIIDYLKDFWPKSGGEIQLDYLLLTHFHSDHMGDGHSSSSSSDNYNNNKWKRSKSQSGNYVESGISELASKIPIGKIIDRGFPNYDDPVDLKSLHDKSMDNYLAFVEENKEYIKFEQFDVGSSKQIVMKNIHDKQEEDIPDFRVRVLKSGSQVAAPHEGHSHEQIPGKEVLKDYAHGCENAMSAAFIIEYGPFSYYEGADQEVIRNKDGDIIYDTIGPTARAAGEVDVATLNHHGHGVSNEFLRYLDPHIMILQGWSSDQPPASSMELLAGAKQEVKGVPRKVFATDIFQERINDLGSTLSDLFQSKSGHVLVRVHPHERAGNLRDRRQTFQVIILDGNHRVKAEYGHFPVRKNQ